MAHKKAGDKQAKQNPNIQADHNSVAIGGISTGGDLSGEVNIATGNIAIHKGYTVEEVTRIITQIKSEFRPKPFDGRCPYKGLDVFEEEDSDLFFGRERLVEDLVSRVKESRAVFITGPSGSGKSSLVRAGLIPALKQGMIKSLRSERWLYATMKPGREPLTDLALVFARLKGPDLADYFEAHADETKILNRCAESVLSEAKDQRLVLFIDQFEEVFTQVNQETKRQIFLDMLTHAATVENGRVIVLFSIRSDFISNCATYPLLNELLSQEFRQIGAMQPDELVSAIALPAIQVGLPIEDELIARIINDMKGEPGALPLMQFALKDLFDSRLEKGGIITLTLRNYLQHGGLHQSLERHADNSFAKLSKSEQELARSIFSGLIEIGRSTQDTRRTALLEELIPANTKATDVGAVIQKLADARLITTDEQAGKDIVTISHEKLIDAWPWLKKLVNENRDAIALKNEVANDAKEWDDHQRDPSYLYTGTRLVRVREQLEARKLVLSGLAYEFVQLARAQQRRKRLLNRLGIVTISIGMIMAVVVFSVQSNEYQKIANTAQAASTDAVAQKSTAQAASTLAVEQAVEAQRQTNIALARQLAAQSEMLRLQRLDLNTRSVLLGIESINLSQSLSADQAIRNGLNLLLLPVKQFQGRSTLGAIAISPDDQYMALGFLDNTVEIVDFESGITVETIRLEPGIAPSSCSSCDGITSLTFSLDGQYLGIGNRKGTIKVVDMADQISILDLHLREVVSKIEFSPDRQYLVAATGDPARVGPENFGYVEIWSISSSKMINKYEYDSPVVGISFLSKTDELISALWNGSVYIQGFQNGAVSYSEKFDSVIYDIDISPNENYLAIASSANKAIIFDLDAKREVAQFDHDQAVYGVIFNSNGDYLATLGFDEVIRIWDFDRRQEFGRETLDRGFGNVAFSNNRLYFIASLGDNTIWVWKMENGKEMKRLEIEDDPDKISIDQNEKYMVVSGRNSGPIIWDLAKQEITDTYAIQGMQTAAISPNGEKISWAGWYSEKITAIDFPENTSAFEVNDSSSFYDIKYSDNGELLAIAGDSHISLRDANNGQEIISIKTEGRIEEIDFSPDGKHIAAAKMDQRSAGYYDISTGVEIANFPSDSSVVAVAISPDGEYLASASWDKTVRVWSISPTKEVLRLLHEAGVWAVAFSKDSQYLATGDEDGVVHVWNFTTGNEVARMLHDSVVTDLIFSKDSRYLFSSSWDGTIRQWILWPEDLISEACRRVMRNLTRAEWEQYFPGEEYRVTCPQWPLAPTPISSPSP